MDPLYAVDHAYASGDVVSVSGSLDLLVRGPVGGYLPERIVAYGRIHPRQPRFDVDADAVVDLVTVEGTTLVVYRGGSDGVFAGAPLVPAHGAGDAVRTIVAGDLDGDARADVAVCDGLGVLVVSSGGAP